MGIKGLETFIQSKEHGHNISQTIDIREEISKWRLEHGKDPTIVFDIKELNRRLAFLDVVGTTFGGKYIKWNETLEYFFTELKNCNAKLVFMVRLSGGPREKGIDVYKTPYQAYDFIKEKNEKRQSYDDGKKNFIPSVQPNQRMYYNLLNICKEYGEVFTSYGLRKEAILGYAQEHKEDVIAVVTRNTEYFIYHSDFQYWSLSDKMNELKVAKFCRETLNKVHGLNYKQMQLMMAIFQVENKKKKYSKFLDKVELIKKLNMDSVGYELNTYFSERSCQRILEKMNGFEDNAHFDGNWNDDIYSVFLTELLEDDAEFKAVLQFIKKHLYFIYKLVNDEKSGPQDLLFIDVRRPDSKKFIELIITVTLKLIGIAFKDVETEKRPKTRKIQIKRDATQAAEQTEMKIIYPTIALPSLNDLIVQEDDTSFDLNRWLLLHWLLGVDENEISKIRASGDSEFIRVVALTLKFLQSHQIISEPESEAILRAEKQHEMKSNVYVPMPKFEYPAYVAVEWIQTSHKYTIAFELICHCLELCGLRKETALIRFEANTFYENMRRAQKQSALNNP